MSVQLHARWKATCGTCGHRVVFAKRRNGSLIVMDPEPAKDGEYVVVMMNGGGSVVGPGPGTTRYDRHPHDVEAPAPRVGMKAPTV